MHLLLLPRAVCSTMRRDKLGIYASSVFPGQLFWRWFVGSYLPSKRVSIFWTSPFSSRMKWIHMPLSRHTNGVRRGEILFMIHICPSDLFSLFFNRLSAHILLSFSSFRLPGLGLPWPGAASLVSVLLNSTGFHWRTVHRLLFRRFGGASLCPRTLFHNRLQTHFVDIHMYIVHVSLVRRLCETQAVKLPD